MKIQKQYVTDLAPEEEQYFYEFHIERPEDIIDGDTMDINIDVGFGITIRERIRLYGINTPEMKTLEGKKVRSLIEKLLWRGRASKQYFIHTMKKNLKNQNGLMAFSDDVKKGKYGRYLGDVYVKESDGDIWHLNETILANGLAREFMKK